MVQPATDRKVALITGSSSGLGLAIAKRFASAGFDLIMVGRNESRLREATSSIEARVRIESIVCDVTDRAAIQTMISEAEKQFGRLDVLINNVGMSDRGLMKSLEAERLEELFAANVFSALGCSQAALPMLESTKGQIINIGSLGAKVAPRYLGGYAAAKHALAAITQQMRLELREVGVNVMLVSPGPIRRDDAGERYKDRVTDDLPESANRAAGGTTLKGLSPDYVAERIYRASTRRAADVILPSYLRPIISIGHLIPRLGDWLLLRFTRNK